MVGCSAGVDARAEIGSGVAHAEVGEGDPHAGMGVDRRICRMALALGHPVGQPLDLVWCGPAAA